MVEVEVMVSDITALNVDAIVNSANTGFLTGGGVDGEIRRKAGPELLVECKRIRKDYPHGIPVAKPILTAGYKLLAKFIIHVVGPDNQSEELLRETYNNCFKMAEENNLATIAVPSISTGVFGFPKPLAARIVKDVVKKFPFNNVKKVILCFLDEKDAYIYSDFS